MQPDTQPQKRIFFYSFDRGSGIGHLRKLSRIAQALQGPAACLISTCHRQAAELLVPPECEYVRLPGWDGLLGERAAYWGREPFLHTDRAGARALRASILRGVVDGFQPDAIVVDHIPLGGEEELAEILATTDCRKYLITRGIQNETEDLKRLIFQGKAKEAMERYYNAILAAIDPAVFNFTDTYDLGPLIAGKTHHLGYLGDPVSADRIFLARQWRGASGQNPWVVASAGGGQNGEPLLRACLDLAPQYPEVLFDIVLGPRSRLAVGEFDKITAENPHIRLHSVSTELPLMNASADVAITGGGYNTLVEIMHGNAQVICIPLRRSEQDEQAKNARILSEFMPVEMSPDPGDLGPMLDRALARSHSKAANDRRKSLNLNGVAGISRWIMDDLQSCVQRG